MPPYRANLGGMFGSGMTPRPGGNIDVASAINAIGNQASSLVQAAYLRKVNEQQRRAAEAANARAIADEQYRRDFERQKFEADRAFRERDLAFREAEAVRARAEAAARREESLLPKPVYDSERGVWITPPKRGAVGGGGVTEIPGLPAKPKSERSSAAGTFYPQVDPQTGAATYFNPQTGVTVQAPGGLQPRDAATANNIVVGRRAIASTRDALAQLRKNIETNGVAFRPGVAQAGQETDYRKFQLQLKELLNLGVLNGPDLEIMEQIIAPPTSVGTQVRARLGGATPEQLVLAQILKMERELENRERNLMQSSATRSGAPAGRPGVDRPPFDPNDPD